MRVGRYLEIRQGRGKAPTEAELEACEDFDKKAAKVTRSRGFRKAIQRAAEGYRRRETVTARSSQRRPAAIGQRRREHRSKAKRIRAVAASSSRSTSRGDPDREPPLERPCEGCGEPFTPSRPNQRHHDARCRTAAYRSRRSLMPRFREIVLAARRHGDIDEFEAIELLATGPSDRVLTLLTNPRAKLEYRAQPDPAKRLAGELAWARDIVDAVICETWRAAA